MSLDNARAFIDTLQSDQNLQEKTRKELGQHERHESFNNAVSIGAEAGFEFTANEIEEAWKELMAKAKDPELSNMELDAVAGGKADNPNLTDGPCK